MSAPSPFAARYGPWALVLGGSEGIGLAFAESLARRGVHPVVAALPDAALDGLAARLEARYGVEARAVPVDLAGHDAVSRVARACEGLAIGCLVYNAGISRVGRFVDVPLGEHERVLDVNARGPLRFLHAFLPPMRARGHGGAILLSSMAGLQGAPWLASYAATKAFDLVLAESLWAELRPDGVDVLGVVAGATRTPGWIAAGADRATSPVMEPGDVAERALRALGRRPVLVPGWRNRAAVSLLGALPRAWATRLVDGATKAMRTPRPPQPSPSSPEGIVNGQLESTVPPSTSSTLPVTHDPAGDSR